MDIKAVVIFVALFLSVLFLSTVGSVYTGNAVLQQTDITLSNYPYPFVKNNVPNGIFIVIPYDYSYDDYSTAQVISNSLKGNNILGPEIVTTDSLPKGEYNLILIGNPCNNNFISNELATVECDLGLEEGQGLLMLINHDRTSTLVVSGDLIKSSLVLTNYNFYPLMNKLIIVDGDIGNLVLNYH